MSATATPAEALEKAAQHVATTVYAPAFFDKLAAYGVNPQSDNDREQLLQMAVMLREAGWEPQVQKTAAQNRGNGFLGHCLAELQNHLQSQPENIKLAALNEVRRNPELKAAALELAKATGRVSAV